MVDKKEEKKQPTVLAIMAAKNKLAPDKFLNVIKSTVMKPGKDGRMASNEEIAAFLIVAQKYKLDPFTNEIYAFPSRKGGVIPVVGIDGFVSIVNRHKDFDGMEIIFSEEEVENTGAKSCPQWCEVKIYRKNTQHPIIVREYLDEVYCAPKGGYPGAWQTHTKRMLRHKAIIQAARIAFGIGGLYDPDEADRIIDAELVENGSRKPAVEQPKTISEQKEQKPREGISAAHIQAIKQFSDKVSGGTILVDETLKECGVKEIAELTANEAKKLIDILTKKLEEQDK